MGNSRHLGSGTLNVIMEMFTKMNNFSVKVIAEIVNIALHFSSLMPSSMDAGLKLIHRRTNANGENSNASLVSKWELA